MAMALTLFLFVGTVAVLSSFATLLKLPRNQFLEIVGGAWSFFWWTVWALNAQAITVYSGDSAFNTGHEALTWLGFGAGSIMLLFAIMGVLGQLEPLENKSDLKTPR